MDREGMGQEGLGEVSPCPMGQYTRSGLPLDRERVGLRSTLAGKLILYNSVSMIV